MFNNPFDLITWEPTFRTVIFDKKKVSKCYSVTNKWRF